MALRAVVFGSSGQLGVELVRELAERGYRVTGFERTAVDITNRERVEQVLADRDARLVFNAAAYNQVDVAEKEPQAAFVANVLGVRNLALACRQVDAQLIHFSTDYVFDGTSARPYREDDPPHPLGAYAISKLAGELCAQAYLDRPLIVRTCGVFGPGGLRTNRGNFLELMLRRAADGQPIRVVEDHIGSPTYAPMLAARTIDLVEKNQHGIFHIGGGTAISWFNFAKLIFETAGLNPSLQPTNEREYRTPARRPKYSALDNAKIESAGLDPMPPLAECVKMYLAVRAKLVEHARDLAGMGHHR
jgi:dTDP-4-dehydrorhamnose reductase